MSKAAKAIRISRNWRAYQADCRLESNVGRFPAMSIVPLLRRFYTVKWLGAAVLLFLLISPEVRTAPSETRLLRQPDVSKDAVVFVYAGDLWTASRSGGEARRLTSHPGDELYPKFSPDGKWIAFTGEYDGNADVYIIPSEGGEPGRLTYHPGNDQVLGWTPDSKKVLFRSNRASAPAATTRL